MDDIPALLKLAERFICTESNIAMEFDPVASRNYLEQYIRHQEAAVFIPEDLTALIMVTICRDWSVRPVCYIENLYISPEARGKGLSRVLVMAAENYARFSNCSHIFASNHTTLGNRIGKMFDNLLTKSGFENCGSNFLKVM